MAPVPGLHTFRIETKGVHVYPRVTAPADGHASVLSDERVLVGVPGLDPLLGGGLPAGDLTIVAGPSGTGKTAFCTHFIAEGARLGQPGVLAIFEEQPLDYLSRAKTMGFDLEAMVAAGTIRIICLRPLDLSPAELLYAIQSAVDEIGARRLVIDSLNGLELSLAPTFREDFQEALYRLVAWLSGGSVSTVMTVEVAEAFHEIKFSPHAVSFLAQNIIFLRYVELEGELNKILTIIKMRRSEHSRGLHAYDIGSSGMHVSDPLKSYVGVITGVPVPAPGKVMP